MLPGRERLRAIATGGEGSLREVPYAVLLSAVALEKRDCVAVLTSKQTEKRIFFAGGVPVECLSNLLHETFGRYLVGQRKITEEQFELAFAIANATGTRLGEVLVGQKVFPREEADKLLQQNLARKLLDGFSWHEGRYQLLPDPPAFPDAPRLNVAQLIVAGVARFAPQASVDAAIGMLVGKNLALHPSPPFPLSEIRLSEGQARLAAALEKRPRIDELAVTAKLPFEEISRVLYALWLLGTVVTADQVPRLPSSPRPPAPPPGTAGATGATAAPPAAPPALQRPAVETAREAAAPGDTRSRRRRDELRRAFDMQRSLDAFDFLGLTDDASEEAIRERFLAKAREWAPWQYDDAGDVDRANALFLQAAGAYGELTNRATRESLQRSRRVTGQAVSGGGFRRSVPNLFAIKTDVLDAERKHRKGAELLATGSFKDALPLLQIAAECDPQNGNWAAEAAYCKFMAGGKTGHAAALRAMEDAIRIDEDAGLACFYAGEVLRAKGDLPLAERFYRKASKLMEGDKRPLDALRELKR